MNIRRAPGLALLITALLVCSNPGNADPGAPSAMAPATDAHAAMPTAILSGECPGTQQLKDRILLDDRLRPAQWRQAGLIWVLGSPAGLAESWPRILERVQQGQAGLILVPGERLPDLSPLGLRATTHLTERHSLEVTPRSASGPLTGQVVWQTAPQAASRWRLERLNSSPLAVAVQEQGTDSPVILTGKFGRGRVAVLSLRLCAPSNQELVLWPYFNYMLQVLSSEQAGLTPATFAAWPASPVPGKRTFWTLMIGLGIAWILTMGLFFRVRRYSRAHPEILDTFFQRAEEKTCARAAAVRAKAASADPPGSTPEGSAGLVAGVGPGVAARASDGWRSIGFSRSLAGFLTLAGTLFVLFAPFYYVTNVLIPNHVQPFPQAKGIWDFAWEGLQVFWFLFDAGTYVAFVKYFAEFRVKDPREAIRSAQFFCWWQILTGLVQVTMACLVAVFILPHTRFGYSSTFWILIALSQYPGVFAVMNFFFQAYQRYDYNIGLDLLADWVLRFVLQIPFVLLFRAWGAANPAYGEAFGAVVGIGCGFYVSQLVTFALGTVLYKRLGLGLAPLFMAHFDRKTASRMLRFGLKVVLGKVFFRAAKTIDRVVIAALLINYTEWLGLEGQIHYNLMFLFPIAYRFFETSMAALSESHGNGKETLTQYYVARFFQIGSLYTAIALSIFLALGPMFVRHAMDAQWARAADFMIIAAVAGAFSAPAWLSDMLQKGAGRPGLFAVILGVEQVLRIGLFYLLIPMFQFWGFYWALLITIMLKVVGGWVVNHLLILRLRLFPWQMFAAPALAGLANYLLLRGVSALLGLDGRLEVIVLFFGCSLVSFFVCFFACGLAGGFDRALGEELDRASKMTGVLRPLTRLFYWAARAGWSLSPLHNRFPVTIHEEAMTEAAELEAQRQAVDSGAS